MKKIYSCTCGVQTGLFFKVFDYAFCVFVFEVFVPMFFVKIVYFADFGVLHVPNIIYCAFCPVEILVFLILIVVFYCLYASVVYCNLFREVVVLIVCVCIGE